MNSDKHTRSTFRDEVEKRHRLPQRCWLPEFATLQLWRLAASLGEHPTETASRLLVERLFPARKDRRRRLRRWRQQLRRAEPPRTVEDLEVAA